MAWCLIERCKTCGDDLDKESGKCLVCEAMEKQIPGIKEWVIKIIAKREYNREKDIDWARNRVRPKDKKK